MCAKICARAAGSHSHCGVACSVMASADHSSAPLGLAQLHADHPVSTSSLFRDACRHHGLKLPQLSIANATFLKTVYGTQKVVSAGPDVADRSCEYVNHGRLRLPARISRPLPVRAECNRPFSHSICGNADPTGSIRRDPAGDLAPKQRENCATRVCLGNALNDAPASTPAPLP